MHMDELVRCVEQFFLTIWLYVTDQSENKGF